MNNRTIGQFESDVTWFCFCFAFVWSHAWYHSEGEGLREIGCTRSRKWKNFGYRWTKGVEGLENWTVFMDVICVSSLTTILAVIF